GLVAAPHTSPPGCGRQNKKPPTRICGFVVFSRFFFNIPFNLADIIFYNPFNAVSYKQMTLATLFSGCLYRWGPFH
ncbi:hypothetical protein, partial [Enterobacter asburiae]